MEPITLVTVLTAGAGLIAKGVLGEAAKDAYKAVRDHLRDKFGAGVDTAVTALETAPDSEALQKLVMDQLASVQAAHDETLLRLTEKLEAAIKSNPQGQQALSKYNIQISGGQVGVIGDNAKITGGIHFGEKK
jgi:ABC-type transporter Mla subunit MlaD